MVVGSGALLGRLGFGQEGRTSNLNLRRPLWRVVAVIVKSAQVHGALLFFRMLLGVFLQIVSNNEEPYDESEDQDSC
jgi:hypothetical protein